MTLPPLLRKRRDEDASVERERGRDFYLVCWLLSLIFDAVCFTIGFFFCCYQYSYYCHWANLLISGYCWIPFLCFDVCNKSWPCLYYVTHLSCYKIISMTWVWISIWVPTEPSPFKSILWGVLRIKEMT